MGPRNAGIKINTVRVHLEMADWYSVALKVQHDLHFSCSSNELIANIESEKY